MTDKYVSFMLFTNVHMINGDNGVDYDQPPCGNFIINVKSGIVQTIPPNDCIITWCTYEFKPDRDNI